MIKLKDILLENSSPSIFTTRRTDDRLARYASNQLRKSIKLVDDYIAGGSKGDLNLFRLDLTELPHNLKNVKVRGSFYCGRNQLNSLRGAPKSVDFGFYCFDNKLTSLEGAPSSVGGNFDCSNNKLPSLEYAPKSVRGVFHCGNNKLTSLDYAPKSVGGDFYCMSNTVKFTKQDVKAVCDVKGRISV